MAEALGQAATQAPQPMQAAASMASSASTLGMAMALASGAAPVGDRDEAAGLHDAVEGAAVHDEVADHVEGLGAPRLEPELVAVLERTHVELAGGRQATGAVGLAVDHHAAGAADALTAIVIEGDGVLARIDEALVDDVEHLEERHVGAHAPCFVALEAARRLGVLLPPDVQLEVQGLTSVGRHL